MKQLNPAEKQDSLDVLNYQIRCCNNCGLFASRKYALVGEGNPDSPFMFVALSPGFKENEENKMFIGPSGQVFNTLLRTASISRESIFMTNLVKCMLPKNRKPKSGEIKACIPFLMEEISIVNPEIIVPLGAYATNAIIAGLNPYTLPGINFSRLNGQITTINKRKVYPLPHPAALLYNPGFELNTIEKYRMLKNYL
ncbi:MAG: uracil-DNA glycosylase [Bacteroidales bacterium]|jgi:DNA polymerase|nr:uracil-DNA glycosylase [Bacteroidales bacterium]